MHGNSFLRFMGLDGPARATLVIDGAGPDPAAAQKHAVIADGSRDQSKLVAIVPRFAAMDHEIAVR
jgi:hypothetical protein